MKIVLGIDIGGSTTKTVAFGENKQIIDVLQVKAADQITSLYGAIGHMLYKNGFSLGDVSKTVMTGVGATWVDGDIYGIPTFRVKEFEAIGEGGLILSGLNKALVVSMGTGTAFVTAENGVYSHIGGSGVGGGTLVGLSSKLLGESNVEAIVEMAKHGSLENVDLMIREISRDVIPSLPPHATASNFGNLKSTASKEDMALGLMNTVFQTVGMLAVFALRGTELEKVVITGTLATLPQAAELLGEVGKLYNIDFIVPENAAFATALGAASLCLK